jgi:hypothetical protein
MRLGKYFSGLTVIEKRESWDAQLSSSLPPLTQDLAFSKPHLARAEDCHFEDSRKGLPLHSSWAPKLLGALHWFQRCLKFVIAGKVS